MSPLLDQLVITAASCVVAFVVAAQVAYRVARLHLSGGEDGP